MSFVVAETTMTTMVEGIGDEVVYFFGFSLLILLLVLAWSSTSVTDNGMIRAAVFVIERRRRSSNERRVNETNENATTTVSDSIAVNNTNDASLNSEGTLNEEEKTKDVKPAVVKEDLDKTSSNSSSEGEQSIENDSNTSENADEEDDVDVIEGQIKVRLKFLNDTQKLVDARLADQLGHFKQRHFGEELENNKVVRLIFNGQLLQRDQETLMNYGLFDNCVVHCHISSGANPSSAPQSPSSSSSSSSQSPFSSPHVELDLSRLMLPLFGLILGLIWCCRMQYRQYFNATSTFALLCITGLFVVSVFAICMPTRSAQRH